MKANKNYLAEHSGEISQKFRALDDAIDRLHQVVCRQTIIERAEKYSENKWGMGLVRTLERFHSKEGYIKGASDQLNIDIERACDAFCKTHCPNLMSLPSATPSGCGGRIHDDCDDLHKFIRLMKGE